jgi:maltose alpha-D-glucosyltransferase/alpha-amylase
MDFSLHFGSPGYGSLFRKPYSGSGYDRYGFCFFDRSGHGNIREFLDEYLYHLKNMRGLGYIAIPTGNHDINPRIAINRDAQDMELVYLFLMTIPGIPYIYYGDEIGMTSLPGIPSKEGGFERTASRTPMQWNHAANAGFSSAVKEKLYLPVDERPERVSVEQQEIDPASLLNRVRRLVKMRHDQPALRAGSDFEPVFAEAGKLPLVYLRAQGSERILVAINPGEQSVTATLNGLHVTAIEPLFGPAGALQETPQGWKLVLPGVSGIAYKV